MLKSVLTACVFLCGCDVDLDDWRENAGAKDAAPAASSTSADASRDQSPEGACADKLERIHTGYPVGYRGTNGWFYGNEPSDKVVYGIQTFPCSGGRGSIYGLDNSRLEFPVNSPEWAGNHCWTPKEWSGATCLDEDGRISCQIVDTLRASATLLYDPVLLTCNWFLYPDFANVLVCPLDGPCSFGGVANSPLSAYGDAGVDAGVDAGTAANAGTGAANSVVDASF